MTRPAPAVVCLAVSMPPKAASRTGAPMAKKPPGGEAGGTGGGGTSSPTRGSALPRAKASAAPAAAKTSKGKAGRAAPAPKKAGPTPAEMEEQTYLEEKGNEAIAADPWAGLRSAYGGSLSPAECFDRLEALRTKTQPVHIDAAVLARAQAALDPPSPSSLIAQARALDALLERHSPESTQRVSLAGCGLERVQIGELLASRALELDLSGNPIREIDALAGSCLRGIEASGCRLTRVPRFANSYDKLVCLNLSFNDLGSLPEASTMAPLSNLRRLGLQNCMLVSIAGKGPSSRGPDAGRTSSSALAAMANLRDLDLSFNLLAEPAELSLLTHLQRLDFLDVGCNEMCVHPEYHSSVKALRQRVGTLKRLNDEAVVNSFVGYGRDAAMEQHVGEARLAGLDRDNSSCSCVEGNPCLAPDTCLDWKNRFAVTYKVRMDKFWSKGFNFG